MIKDNKTKTYQNKALLTSALLFLLFCSCDPRFGCVESSFTLAKESSLPKWYTLPPHYSRDDVTIEIIHYLKTTKIITYGPPPERKILKEQIATSRQHPITEAVEEEERKRRRTSPEVNYSFPRYQIITVDGIEEAFEHRDSNGPVAFLYVTDDPKITAYLKKGNIKETK